LRQDNSGFAVALPNAPQREVRSISNTPLNMTLEEPEIPKVENEAALGTTSIMNLSQEIGNPRAEAAQGMSEFSLPQKETRSPQ
jgi:hypothetical protein